MGKIYNNIDTVVAERHTMYMYTPTYIIHLMVIPKNIASFQASYL